MPLALVSTAAQAVDVSFCVGVTAAHSSRSPPSETPDLRTQVPVALARRSLQVGATGAVTPEAVGQPAVAAQAQTAPSVPAAATQAPVA